MHLDRMVAEEQQLKGQRSVTKPSSQSIQPGLRRANLPKKLSPLDEFISLLYAISPLVDRDVILIEMNKVRENLSVPNCDLLEILGQSFDTLFGANEVEASSKVQVRSLPEPSRSAANRADMLIAINDDHHQQHGLSSASGGGGSGGGETGLSSSSPHQERGSRSLPAFVTCTDTPSQVIDVVLSIYVRRGRLPEPGEIMFCAPNTSLEEIELILLRFLMAKKRGRGQHVFTIADLHMLRCIRECQHPRIHTFYYKFPLLFVVVVVVVVFSC
jgi:hypothetical protein